MISAINKPEIADRFVNFLVGGVHLDPLLLRNESGADFATELLVIPRPLKFFDCFLDLEFNVLHVLSSSNDPFLKECQLPKLNAVGSNPISRSMFSTP